MLSYFQFLAQASLVLLVLFVCFWLLVRKETFFQLNRWVLLSIIVLSICIPLFPVQSWVGKMNLPAILNHNETSVWSQLSEPPSLLETKPNLETASSLSTPLHSAEYAPNLIAVETSSFSYQGLLSGIYWVVFSLLLLRFFIHTTRILRLLFKSECLRQDGFTYVIPSNRINPFSFFNFLFFNPQHFDNQEFEQIQIHEKVHASQWHSIDLLIAELTTIFFWFHPGAWLLNRSIRQNLEYIADAVVLQTGVSKKNYQYHLLRVSVPDYASRLTNHFNHSLLKKRIVMMNVNQSSHRNKWKYCFFLPISMSLFVLLNYSTQAQTITSASVGKATETTTQTIGNTQISTISDDKGVYSVAQTVAGEGERRAQAIGGSGNNATSNNVGAGVSAVAETPSTSVGSSIITVERGEARVSSPTYKGAGIGKNKSSKEASTPSLKKDLILVVITAEFDQAQLDRLKNDLKKEQFIINYEDVTFNDEGKLSSIKVKVKTEDGSFNGSAMSFGKDGEPIEEPVIFYYLFNKEGTGKYRDIKTWGVVTGKETKYIPEEIKPHLDKVKNGYVIGTIYSE